MSKRAVAGVAGTDMARERHFAVHGGLLCGARSPRRAQDARDTTCPACLALLRDRHDAVMRAVDQVATEGPGRRRRREAAS